MHAISLAYFFSFSGILLYSYSTQLHSNYNNIYFVWRLNLVTLKKIMMCEKKHPVQL